ncbi:hypothetical protein BSR28_04935 [Boudabousia liubingyangii]|nr:hypothetical protein BSR28_04935 [Boudabousia liubingyangii]
MAEKVNVLRSSMTIAAGTMTSRVLGFIRGALFIAVLGAVGVQDSFQVANNLPNLMYGLLAGSVISAVLLPEIVRAFKRSDGGKDYVDRLLTFTFVTLLAITVVLTLAANVVVYATSPMLSPAVKGLAITWSYWFMPQIFFYGMQSVLGQVLNARGHFWEAAWSPVLNNVVSILGLFYYVWLFGWAPKGYYDPADFTYTQMMVIAIPTTLGIVLQGVSLIWPLKKAGYTWNFKWGFRGYGLGRAFRIAMWTMFSAITFMLSTIVVQILASGAEAYGHAHEVIVAGPAARANATTIFMLPHSVITASVATALFAQIATYAAAGEGSKVREVLEIYLHKIAQITVFFAICMVVFAVPIMQAYAASRGSAEIASYAAVLRAFAPRLVFMALFIVEVDVLLSYGRAKQAFYGYLIKALALVFICGSVALFASAANWVVYSAAAESASFLVGAAVLYYEVDKILPGKTTDLVVRNLLGTLIAAVPAALVGSIFMYFAGEFTVGRTGYVLLFALIKGAIGGLLVLLTFLGGLWIIGDREAFANLKKLGARFGLVKRG